MHCGIAQNYFIWNAFPEYRFHLPQGLLTIPKLLLQAQTKGKNLESWQCYCGRFGSAEIISELTIQISSITGCREHPASPARVQQRKYYNLTSTILQCSLTKKTVSTSFTFLEGKLWRSEFQRYWQSWTRHGDSGQLRSSRSVFVRADSPPIFLWHGWSISSSLGVSFTLEIGCSPFILEGDSSLVIKTLCSKERSLSLFGHILELVKAMTKANYISFSHVQWIGNAVAHNLTKHTRHVSGYTIWMENVPPHFYSIHEADIGWSF